MICREPVNINPKLFAIMKMVLINHSKTFRQELQGDAIIDIISFFLIIGIPALIVAITMFVAPKHYGDDKM